MYKKIIIFGFPHSGTTILRNIISHIENVYEIVDEVSKIDDNIEPIKEGIEGVEKASTALGTE